MPSKSEAVREELAQLRDDLRSLAVVLREEPKTRRRKESAWRLLYGGLGAGLALAARRLTGRLWWILTGRTPPAKA